MHEHDQERPDTEAEPRDFWPFAALEGATLIAGIGNGVAAIALPWLTLELTNDPAAAGIVVAASALPTLGASLASGVIIDRLGRKRTSVGSDIFSAVSAAMIPVFGLLQVLTYPLVLIASALGAVFDPVGLTARESLLPDVAKKARLPLERVNGAHEAVWGMAFLIGPGIAGVLIGAIGAVDSFWMLFAGFGISALLVGAARMPPPPKRSGDPPHWLADALEGLRFVVREPAIRATTVISTLAFAAAYSTLSVVLPVIFERQEQPEALGALFVAFSAGGVIGALAYSGIGHRLARRPAFLIGIAATVPLTGVFALEAPYAVQLAVMAVAGFLTGPVGPIANVVLQERTAEEIRGRALSMAFALSYALFPASYVAAGFLAREAGTAATAAIMATAVAVVALWSFFSPGLRALQSPAAE